MEKKPLAQGVITFNEPYLTGREQELLREIFANKHFSGAGPMGKRVEAYFEKELGTKRALLTTSCTHALEMAALLLDLAPGDEVIVPSFTFVSTPNSFVLRGAKPVFADVTPDTLCLDPKSVEKLITKKTKAVFPVHYAGIACDMDPILEMAKASNFAVVEDNAHGLFGKYKGRTLGTLGQLGAQSFHETKNFSCGEGGALLVNDPKFIERAEIIREKGTDRSRFFRGMVDKYTWQGVGSSYVLSDILAAMLWAQLLEKEKIQGARRWIWNTYFKELAPWAERNGVQFPHVPSYSDNPYHMFYMLLPSLEERDRFIAHMKAERIGAVFHYLPLHLSPVGRGYGYRGGELPVTENISDRLVRLPFFNAMTEGQLARIVSTAASFKAAARQPLRKAG